MGFSGKENSLRKVLGSLASVPEEEWQFFQGLLRRKSVPAKSVLLEQGGEAKAIFFVMEGLLKNSFIEASGAEINKGFVIENGLCAPYVSILTQQPSTFTITAMEDTDLIEVDAREIKRLYARHPCWQEIGRKIAEGLLIEKERREYQMLALSAQERYTAFQKNYPELPKRLPQYEVASYLGMTPVALSQIRKRMAKR